MEMLDVFIILRVAVATMMVLRPQVKVYEIIHFNVIIFQYISVISQQIYFKIEGRNRTLRNSPEIHKLCRYPSGTREHKVPIEEGQKNIH